MQVYLTFFLVRLLYDAFRIIKENIYSMQEDNNLFRKPPLIFTANFVDTGI